MNKKMGFYEATVKVLGDTDRKDETEVVKTIKREAMSIDTSLEDLTFKARRIASMFGKCVASLENGMVTISDPSGHCDTDKFPIVVALHDAKIAAFRVLVRTALGSEVLGRIIDNIAND